MTLNEYQGATAETAIYPKDMNLEYCVAGVCSEAGEVAGKWKKYIRGDTNFHQMRTNMRSELGDVLWYVARLADELDIGLDDIASENILKLLDRKDRDKLTGDGDSR